MGSYASAVEHIVQAKRAGADAVKFQLFRPEDIAIDPSAIDPRTVTPPDWIPRLHASCLENGITFMCTPFSEWAVDLLNPYVSIWKVGSFEHARTDIIDAVEVTHKPVIASCGRGTPSTDAPWYLLYCVSKYPADPDDIRFPPFYPFGRFDGFSDHTISTIIPALAVAHGAVIIEKHMRLDDTQTDSPDHPHSLDPVRFGKMVAHIRVAESTCLRPHTIFPEQSRYPNRRE